MLRERLLSCSLQLGLGLPEAGKWTPQLLGSYRLPMGSKFSSWEVQKEDTKGKKSYSENTSVYQQGVIKVNEKNYLIRTTPDGGVCTRDVASLICQRRASCAMPSIKVTSSAFPPSWGSSAPPAMGRGSPQVHMWCVYMSVAGYV